MGRAAVFLDRDDTINRNADLPRGAWDGVVEGDLLKPEYALLIDGARGALSALKGAGYALVVITNQGGVARGGGTLRDVESVNDALRALLNDRPGVFGEQLIDAWYCAPHHPSGVVTHFADEHPWRKPGGGMIESACAELGLDPSSSWMVGDKARDLDAAKSAGVPAHRCIRVGSEGNTEDLVGAAEMILGSTPGTEGKEDPGYKIVPASRVRLRASDPKLVPLKDASARSMVEALAHGIAERTGIELHELAVTPEGVDAVIGTHRLGALAFMAQLRRDSNRWHERHDGVPLWDLGDRG